MITWPVGVSWGSTMTAYADRADELAVAAGRVDRQEVAAGIDVVGAVVEVPGRAAVLRDQEADARSVPCCFPACSPVAAMMIDSFGLLLRGKTAIPPMLTPEVGPKLVSGIQVGPLGLVVRKSVVFQMPPLAPAA